MKKLQRQITTAWKRKPEGRNMQQIVHIETEGGKTFTRTTHEVAKVKKKPAENK